jgi:predicted dinucleotide-binding enzyme
MRIGIIGAGEMGKALARRLTALGRGVSIANSWGPQGLARFAAENRASVFSVEQALQAVDIVILAIPTKAVPHLPQGLFTEVTGNAVVIDIGFDPVDTGDLDNSWRQQPGTLAYCQDLDSTALLPALAAADRSRIADYCALEQARIRRQMAQPRTAHA